MSELNDITTDIKLGKYKYEISPPLRRYEPNFVIDAEQTVNWNRQQVKEHNAKVKLAYAVHTNAAKRLARKLRKRIALAISADYNFSTQVVKLIISFVSQNNNSSDHTRYVSNIIAQCNVLNTFRELLNSED